MVMRKYITRENIDLATDILTYGSIGVVSAVGVGVVAPALSVAVGVTATSLSGASLVGIASVKCYSKYNQLINNIKG